MVYEIKYYIALDAHAKNTEYAVRNWKGDVVLEGSCATIYKDVKANLEPYLFSCVVGIEASTAFYPLRNGFLQDHITVRIANVLQIRQLIAKSDPLDARRLSDMLRLGTFPESYIPSEKIQKLRDLVKVRHGFLEELNRTQSRIWATLTREGLRIPERSIFSQKGMAHLKIITESGRAGANLSLLFSYYANIEASLKQATNQLEEYAKNNFPEEWQKLQEIEGIGSLISSYIIAEACPIARFASEKKLRRYAGVIPCTKESAGKFHGSMLPKTSSRALLRWAFTQAAHGAIRTKESKLRLYYNSKKKSKHKAIMAVARSISDMVYKKLKE